MASMTRPGGEEQTLLDRISQPTPRREFLRRVGLGAAAALTVAACDSEDTRTFVVTQPADTVAPPAPTFTAVTLDFSTDTGILNYAYALEQLEAAFYSMVVADAAFTSTFNSEEQRLLVDIKDHEVIHREFFRAALGNSAIPGLTPNFAAINFKSRISVLNAARDFEDLGVSAYNGAGQYFDNTDTGKVLLTVAGKIVSVEARHASAIRDRLEPRSGSFAPNAFDPLRTPSEVLSIASPFIRNTITLTNVPAAS